MSGRGRRLCSSSQNILLEMHSGHPSQDVKMTDMDEELKPPAGAQERETQALKTEVGKSNGLRSRS